MEVAGQWRREWAGTAEFGKNCCKTRLLDVVLTKDINASLFRKKLHIVCFIEKLHRTLHGPPVRLALQGRVDKVEIFTQVTEGGVTRQVARAMEVLHASAPGTRMRVMRAAYHSTAGPGTPASSFMLHSSRRVISSGFNLLESPTFPSKPLEISSTPLESFPDAIAETENYKVTEPDDTEISEPSKWKVASNGSSLRMPSEESSSTDNASIIDLDRRSPHSNIFRKYSYDSENSDILSSKRSSTRASPLLDPPVTLSTLKYKSLLNNSNDWNNRRKSYSFEDTCPANESIIHSNDIIAMESSTDSGICKSTEIVNDQGDENTFYNYHDKIHKHIDDVQSETFKDWLHKNRSKTSYKSVQQPSWRTHDIVIEDPTENKVSLKSPGKVCITVPITIENDESDRKVKKVEFCKTELHFAAESGRVNIIATDEKPPPSNDFRKRRSAFVPISDKFEKPITLFGDKGDPSPIRPIKHNDFSVYGNSEITEDEIENTAATKSILKNKIPKPKPYLLGENTVLGKTDIWETDKSNQTTAATGVSIINKQLEAERKFTSGITSTTRNEVSTGYSKKHNWTIDRGPSETESPTNEKRTIDQVLQKAPTRVDSVKKIVVALPISPVAPVKTRKLRESDLMYFGIDNERKNSVKDKTTFIESVLTSNNKTSDNIFRSVELIKRLSSSACNSEAESEDSPEYQNIILKPDLSQPIPKPRSKYISASQNCKENILHPIVEQSSVGTNSIQESRRSRTKKYEEIVVPTPRSRSEPAKKKISQESRGNSQTKSMKRNTPSPRLQNYKDIEVMRRQPSPIKREVHKSSISEDENPLYVNLKMKNNQFPKRSVHSERHHHKSEMSQDAHDIQNRNKVNSSSRQYKELLLQHDKKSPEKTKSDVLNKSSNAEGSLEKTHIRNKTNKIQRTKKLVTPQQSLCDQPQNEQLTESKLNEAIAISEYKDTSDVRNTKQRQRNKKPKDENLVEQKQSTRSEDKKNDKRYTTKESHSSKESGKGQKIYGISVNDDHKTIDTIEHRSNNETPNSKKAIHKHPMRSEYIINYDDKNGTVSSICKVKSSHPPSKRKTATKEKSKTNSKEIKHRTLDKTPLLQLPEQQWNQNGLTRDRNWKVTNRVQRSCQLL